MFIDTWDKVYVYCCLKIINYIRERERQVDKANIERFLFNWSSSNKFGSKQERGRLICKKDRVMSSVALCPRQKHKLKFIFKWRNLKFKVASVLGKREKIMFRLTFIVWVFALSKSKLLTEHFGHTLFGVVKNGTNTYCFLMLMLTGSFHKLLHTSLKFNKTFYLPLANFASRLPTDQLEAL